MKRHFTSGLALLLPLTLTVIIVNLFINLVTTPFLAIAENLLSRWHFFHHSFFHSLTLLIASKLFVLVSLGFLVVSLGLLADYFFIGSCLRFINDLLHRVPLFNKIYKLFQDIVQTLLSPSSENFSQVVLAPFPHHKSLAVGFVTKPAESQNPSGLFSIFIPGAPNPTVGYLLTFKKEELIFLDLTVEEAMKFILSCGVTAPIACCNRKSAANCL